ncbi:MAG: hypothetical protein EBV51_07215, partial [Acidimicrobiia bacterium]|nr:hypothetical protein [Acidimicrobiia bacterium]
MSAMLATTPEWVDTHCHVTYEDIPGGADVALIAAREAGVKRMITIGTDLKTSKAAIDLAVANADVWATVGLHPHDAK